MAKPFLEPKTANKVKFVYSDDPNTNKIMDELFDMGMVESAFGGKHGEDFDINKYATRMRKDDEKLPFVWGAHHSLISPPPVSTGVSSTSSDSDPEAFDMKEEKAVISSDEDKGAKYYWATMEIFPSKTQYKVGLITIQPTFLTTNLNVWCKILYNIVQS